MIIGYMYLTPNFFFEEEESGALFELRVEKLERFPIYARMKTDENNNILYEDEGFQDKVGVIYNLKVVGFYHLENNYFGYCGEERRLIYAYTQKRILNINSKDQYVELFDERVAVKQSILTGEKKIVRIRDDKDLLRNCYYRECQKKYPEETIYEHKLILNKNKESTALLYITKTKDVLSNTQQQMYEVRKMTKSESVGRKQHTEHEKIKSFYINEDTTEEQAAKEALDFFNSLEWIKKEPKNQALFYYLFIDKNKKDLTKNVRSER